jgi:hypothetical protein
MQSQGSKVFWHCDASALRLSMITARGSSSAMPLGEATSVARKGFAITNIDVYCLKKHGLAVDELDHFVHA